MSSFSYGPVTYNGVTFDTGLQVRCRMQTVYTRSGRKIKYVAYTLEVDAIVTTESCASAGDNVDDEMTDIRMRILREQQRLEASNIGLGYDLVILPTAGGNYPTSTNWKTDSRGTYVERSDVLFGPKPRILDWEPIASSNACRIHWVCDFHLSSCLTNAFSGSQVNEIAQYEYAIVWSINEEGMTSRTINGVLEVANNITDFQNDAPDVGSSNALVTSAEEYALKIAEKFEGIADTGFPLMKGFTRNTQRSLTGDRRQLLFTITDREINTENAYYPGTVRMDVRYQTSSNAKTILNQWIGSISGTIDVQPGYTKKVAWAAMMLIIKERLDHIMKNSKTVIKGAGERYNDTPETSYIKTGQANFYISSFSIGEELFGREVEFSITYWFLSDFWSILSTTNHLEPLDQKNFDWSRWIKTAEQIQNMRGYRQLTHDKKSEVIIGLCDTGYAEARSEKEPESPGDAVSSPILQSGPPAPEASYMDYRNDIDFAEDTNTVTQTLIQSSRDVYSPQKDSSKTQFVRREPNSPHGGVRIAPGSEGDENTEVPDHNVDARRTESQGHDRTYSDNTSNQIIVRRSSSTFTARVKGYAFRVGRASPVPYLYDVNGNECKLVSRRVNISPMGRSNNPLWVTQWDLVYEIDGEPSGELSGLGTGKNTSLLGQPLSEGII